ncbi:hypothetical protein DBR11_11455 [Pedobacter sp. HMWF019]|uniref:hypothetical protein n=1 Tax=Pedobacter sp. HMWF019 TaxID=2056856 RepID=UPI000D3B8D13|nr:hypothetical protein [Pedobacter sp. HMWF019]PTS99882.1 hypothetical protein DBR11_11455 [Pedobacter sp. HMWF019]
MQNEINELRIKGTRFTIDRERQLLYQTRDHNNIVFFDEMINAGAFMLLYYDTKKKNTNDHLQGSFEHEVSIPIKALLHPFSKNLNYVEAYNGTQFQNGVELIFDPVRNRLEQELPKYQIGEDWFIVDVERAQLRHETYPEKVIPFDVMTDMGAYYTFDFDKNTQMAYCPFDDDLGQIINVTVPYMVDLDKEGMAAKYGLSVEVVNNKTDFDLIINPEVLSERKSGIRPTVGIFHYQYEVNIEENSLINTENPKVKISLTDFELSADHNSLVGYIDLNTGRAFNPKKIESLDEFPTGIAHVRIPNHLNLDSFAYGTKRNWLRSYPPVRNHKAEVLPFSNNDYRNLKMKSIDILNKKGVKKASKKKYSNHL